MAINVIKQCIWELLISERRKLVLFTKGKRMSRSRSKLKIRFKVIRSKNLFLLEIACQNNLRCITVSKKSTQKTTHVKRICQFSVELQTRICLGQHGTIVYFLLMKIEIRNRSSYIVLYLTNIKRGMITNKALKSSQNLLIASNHCAGKIIKISVTTFTTAVSTTVASSCSG